MTVTAVQDMRPPILDMDAYSMEVIENPELFHEALRDTAAVVELARYNVYAVGRHDVAKVVLSDNTRFLSGGGVGIQDIRKPGNFRIPSKLVESDPPDHTRVRAAVTKVLTPIVIRQWREMFEHEADTLVDTLLQQGEFDGVEDLAEEYIFKVFPQAVGVRLSRTETLAIGNMRFNQSGPENELHLRAVEEAKPYMDWFMDSCRREHVRPGSIGDLLFGLEDRGDVDPGVASNLLTTFVGGGTDSTIAGLGFALKCFATHPDQWALARAEPARIKNALDEAIRVEPPFRVGYRTTIDREVELSGFVLRPNTKIGVFFGAVTSDPRQWIDPHRFDLKRQVAGVSLAFGTAHHTCIGQMIARLEVECFLTALVKKVATIELTGKPTYRPMNQMRTLRRLPLRVRAA